MCRRVRDLREDNDFSQEYIADIYLAVNQLIQRLKMGKDNYQSTT